MNENELAKKFLEMRNAQKGFFKAARQGNNSEKQLALQLSKKLEGELDQLVHDILNPENKSQTKMFES